MESDSLSSPNAPLPPPPNITESSKGLSLTHILWSDFKCAFRTAAILQGQLFVLVDHHQLDGLLQYHVKTLDARYKERDNLRLHVCPVSWKLT